uniref:Uncharacterized protein n=1 Tax=Anguilla anguilla TaxID=7936 RepID=A0A0E9TNU5_ANGAN
MYCTYMCCMYTMTSF